MCCYQVDDLQEVPVGATVLVSPSSMPIGKHRGKGYEVAFAFCCLHMLIAHDQVETLANDDDDDDDELLSIWMSRPYTK